MKTQDQHACHPVGKSGEAQTRAQQSETNLTKAWKVWGHLLSIIPNPAPTLPPPPPARFCMRCFAPCLLQFMRHSEGAHDWGKLSTSTAKQWCQSSRALHKMQLLFQLKNHLTSGWRTSIPTQIMSTKGPPIKIPTQICKLVNQMFNSL